MKNIDYKELPEWSKKNDLWIYEGDGKFTFIANAITTDSAKRDVVVTKVILAIFAVVLSSLGCFLIGTAFGLDALKTFFLVIGCMCIKFMSTTIDALTSKSN